MVLPSNRCTSSVGYLAVPVSGPGFCTWATWASGPTTMAGSMSPECLGISGYARILTSWDLPSWHPHTPGSREGAHQAHLWQSDACRINSLIISRLKHAASHPSLNHEEESFLKDCALSITLKDLPFNGLTCTNILLPPQKRGGATSD